MNVKIRKKNILYPTKNVHSKAMKKNIIIENIILIIHQCYQYLINFCYYKFHYYETI